MTEWKNKMVLVTGATGLIGSHLTVALLSLGAYVFAMGRNIEKLEKVFSEVENKKLVLLEGNISEKMPNIINGVDYIFHAASPISGDEIREKPVDTISANLSGTEICLEYLKNQGKGRIIVFSSATVYGTQFIKEMNVTEEETSSADTLHNVSASYSESKRMTEVLARAYNKQFDVDCVIVRIGYVYGYTNPSPNTAFYEFINKAVNGENLVLNNSGMARRDNIYVNDVIKGLLIVAQKGKTGEAYNISSNGEGDNYRAIDEMAQMIADSANEYRVNKIRAIVKPFDGERKPGVRLDNSKAKALGWNVEVNLNDGIKDTVRKYVSI